MRSKRIVAARSQFLARFQRKIWKNQWYATLLFELHIVVRPSDKETDIIDSHSEVIQVAPFIVRDPERLYGIIRGFYSKFDRAKEFEVLALHLQNIYGNGSICSLEVHLPDVDFRICSAIINCPHRVWNDELRVPMCER